MSEKRPTREEALKNKEQNKREVEAIVRKLLEHEDFKKYKEKYEAIEQQVTSLMITYTNPDPIQYGFAMKEMALTLRHLGSLLRDVNVNRAKDKDV